MAATMLGRLATGSTLRDAAESVGVAWSTWSDWQRRYTDGTLADERVRALVAAAKRAYHAATCEMTAHLHRVGTGEVDAKEWRAMAFVLEHRRGDPKVIHETRRALHEARIAKARADGTHVEHIDIAGTTDAELDARIAELERGSRGG